LTHKRTLEFDQNDLLPLLFGEHNSHLAHLEKNLGISIANRGNQLNLSGDLSAVEQAETVINLMWARLQQKQDVSIGEIDSALRFLNDRKTKGDNAAQGNGHGKITLKTKKKTITARSPNQETYLEALQSAPMTFGLGPAGTGKTYLAVAMGVSMFLSGTVERLIFTRPVVEAGEKLGFLPGDMKEKVDPYLRPIYDALQDMLPWDLIVKKMESGDIEIAPLAFMRGRTLTNAFVILDEAQNTTTSQMKMFLTRMGESSRMVITGDATQTDLPRGVQSGLNDALEILEGVEEIKFITFDKSDVVRHALVGKIIDAYDKKGR